MATGPRFETRSRAVSAQRKTTLKWDENGELTAVDIARIIERLTHPELRRLEIERSRHRAYESGLSTRVPDWGTLVGGVMAGASKCWT